MPLTLDDLKQRDMTATALRLNRQDIDELVRNCRWLVEYRKNRPDVVARYLSVLRSFTEAQQRALELGMDGCSLAEPIEPLPIWRDDYQWPVLLERLAVPSLRRAA